MTKVQVYTGGSARGNSDDPGGYGAVLHFTDSSDQLYGKTMSSGCIRTTNNRMELMAAVVGLEVLDRPCQVESCSDSKYLTDASSQRQIDSQAAKERNRRKSEPVKNIDPWKHLLEAKEPHQAKFIWVKGHAGYPENEKCDALTTSAVDGENLMTDQRLEV